MDRDAVLAGLARFPRWHYEFDLGGIKTPIHEARRVNRHLQRKAYFFDPLVTLCGGSLAGKRVLDLGCNAGFWSLQAIEAGCDYVLGIDGRQIHVEQSNFVFSALDIAAERYDFVASSVFDLDADLLGSFDVVLFLGLLYHVAKPFELMELISRVNRDLLVIDTRILERKESVFEVIHEGSADPRNSADYGVVLRPSGPAVTDLARLFGYDVVPLAPRFSDYTGASDYDVGLRKAFICSKVTPLQALRTDRRPDRA